MPSVSILAMWMNAATRPRGLAVLAVVATRLALIACGLLAFGTLPDGRTVQTANLQWLPAQTPLLEMWARWDAEWYLFIANHGYDVTPLPSAQLTWPGEALAGFLPLYPMMVRLVAPVFGLVGGALFISNLSLAVAVWLLFRLVRRELGDDAEPAALVATATMLTFPTTLFLSAAYPESTFVALSIGTFLAIRSDRPGMAGVCAAAAILTRPFGVLLILPIVFEVALRRGGTVSARVRRLALALVPPMAALGSWLVFCHVRFGDAFATMEHKSRFRGELSWPWTAFTRWWSEGPVIHGSHGSTFELVMAIAVIGLTVLMLRRIPQSYFVYMVAALALTLGASLWSFSRLALTLIPIYVLVAALWKAERPRIAVIMIAIGGPLSGLLMALYARWWWAG